MGERNGNERTYSKRTYDIEGKTMGFPSLYPDGSSAVGLFMVPAAAAQELIRDSGFEVARVAPGKAVLSLSCVSYRESDCGPYNEIALAFFVKKIGVKSGIPFLGTCVDILRDTSATYIWNLSVTTRLANEAGIQMWGLPKTIEEIELERFGGRAVFSLRMGGAKVLSYEVEAKGALNQPRSTSTVYSIFEGAPHSTSLAHEYEGMGIKLGGGSLQLGDHPLADTLRGLGLPKRPFLATWIEHLSLEVDAPQKL